MDFKVGDKITLKVGIPRWGRQDFDFNVPPDLSQRRRGGQTTSR